MCLSYAALVWNMHTLLRGGVTKKHAGVLARRMARYHWCIIAIVVSSILLYALFTRVAIQRHEIAAIAAAYRPPWAPPTPDTKNTITIWSTDFHISTVADIKHTLSQLRDWKVRFIDKSLSGHCHLMNTCAKDLAILTRDNGLDLGPCPNDLRRDFYEHYSRLLADVDIVLCTHAASQCELYMPFDVSIVVVASTRYEIGRHAISRWQLWNRNLAALATLQHNLIAANNEYDAEYIKYFTSLSSVPVIRSVCGYIVDRYDPLRSEVLLAPARGINPNLSSRILAAASSHNVTIQRIRDLYGNHYEYRQLASHAAAVLLPYQVSFMLFFELYQMGVPMYVPSPKLLVEWHIEFNMLHERTWNSVFRSPSSSSVLPRHIFSHCSRFSDPNDDINASAILEWITLADFYTFPNVSQFDSAEHLLSLLQGNDHRQISADMRRYSEILREQTANAWRNVLVKAKNRSRKVIDASDINTALRERYRTRLLDACDGQAWIDD